MEEDEALIQLAREAFDKHDINQSGNIDQKVGTLRRKAVSISFSSSSFLKRAFKPYYTLCL